MKKNFPPKSAFSWKVFSGFLFLALLWHLPLLISSGSKPVQKSLVGSGMQEHYIVFQKPGYFLSMNGINWMDPTVYLLPSDYGFSSRSRAAWSRTKLVEEDAPPPVLKQDPLMEQKRGGSLTSIEAFTMMETALENANQPDTLLPSTELSPEESVWRVTGGLAERTASNGSALPIMVHTEPLTPTILRVGVAGQGDVHFVLLEESSGYGKADEAAVRFAKGMRFSPVESEVEEELSWGIVKILWRTKNS